MKTRLPFSPRHLALLPLSLLMVLPLVWMFITSIETLPETRHFPPHIRDSLREFWLRAGPGTRLDRVLGDSELLRRFAHDSELPMSVARDFLRRSLRETPSAEFSRFQEIDQKIAQLISEQFLYLPRGNGDCRRRGLR